MKEVMDYLAKAEGTKVHKLDGELDITAPYGIYRHAHPNAEIFTIIDSHAKDVLNIDTPSSEWSKDTIDSINLLLENYKEEVYFLASKFYKEYLKPAHLELFPPLCRVAMFSMYVNSPKNAWKAVQQSLLDRKSSGEYSYDNLSKVDGTFGKKTENGLMIVKSIKSIQSDLYFETLMLSNMKTLYIRLALLNPDKYLKYLKGWDNRMSKLSRE